MFLYSVRYQFEFSTLTAWTGYSYQDKMAPKLFLISLIMIFLVGVSQAKRTNLELAELNQASEDQKIRFFKVSFGLYDSNQDEFVTSDEFDNVDLGTIPFNSLIRETMMEALIKFEQEHENGIEPRLESPLKIIRTL